MEKGEDIRSPDCDATFCRCKVPVPLLGGSSVGRIDQGLVRRAFSLDHWAENLTGTETVIILRLNEKQRRLGVQDGFAQSLPQFSVGPRLRSGSEWDEST